MKKYMITICSLALFFITSCKHENDIRPSGSSSVNQDDGSVEVVEATQLTPVLIAGKSKTSGKTNGTGTNARFKFPYGIFVNNDGSLLVADNGNQAIRKITTAGVVSTYYSKVSDDNFFPYYLAAINDGTMAVATDYYLYFIKSGKVINQSYYSFGDNYVNGVTKDPGGTFFWYILSNDGFISHEYVGPSSSLLSVKPDLSSPKKGAKIVANDYDTGLCTLPSGNKFVTTKTGIWELTAGGATVHILSNTKFGNLISIVATKDATKLYVVDNGDIKLVSRCSTCAVKTTLTLIVPNVHANSVALSSNEKTLYFTSRDYHTVNKVNLP
jgi:hypothetical protein